MYETTEEVLQDALEGVLIAFQMLLLHLDKTRAIDASEYAGMLLDFRSKHVAGESGTGIVIDRILGMLTGEENMEPYVRRLSLHLVEQGDSPIDKPRPPEPGHSE
jgi:hypothetical protein